MKTRKPALLTLVLSLGLLVMPAAAQKPPNPPKLYQLVVETPRAFDETFSTVLDIFADEAAAFEDFQGRITQASRDGGIVESTYDGTQQMLGFTYRVVLTAILIPTDSGARVRMSGQVSQVASGGILGKGSGTPKLEPVTKEHYKGFWAIFERAAAALRTKEP